MKTKWIILGVGVSCFTLGMMAEDKMVRREINKRKPLAVEFWTKVVLSAQEEKLTKDETKALVKNVFGRIPKKWSMEDVVKIINEEIEFLTIVR